MVNSRNGVGIIFSITGFQLVGVTNNESGNRSGEEESLGILEHLFRTSAILSEVKPPSSLMSFEIATIAFSSQRLYVVTAGAFPAPPPPTVAAVVEA